MKRQTMTTDNDASILVRLPRDLKAELMRQAAINGRRITVEVNMRLEASLRLPPPIKPGRQAALQSYSPTPEVRPHLVADGQPLTEHDRTLVALFRQLTPEKQLSLLTLLR